MFARTSWTKTLRRLTSPLGRRIELLEDRSTPASLELAFSPAAFSETTGLAANVGTVTRVGFPLDVPLVVNLASSDTSEVTLPANTVTIPANQTSATFSIRAVDDTLVDGTQTAVITASATDPAGGPTQITGAITYDGTWGSGGYVSANGVAASAVALQPDGKVVAASIHYGTGNNLYDFRVTRYTAAGAIDATFGGQYGVVTDATGQKDIAEKILIQPDGRVLVFGTGLNGPLFNAFAVRYTSDGALDPTFGAGGKVILTPAANQTHEVWDAALQPDGKIVLAGMFNYQYGVARLNADGTLDTAFGAGGYATTSFALGGGRAFGVALQPDGKIVAAGTSWGGNFNSRIVVARFTPAGTLDTSFDGDGKAETDLAGDYDGAGDVVIQGSGRIVVAGRTARAGAYPPIYDLALVGYTPGGTLDGSFGSPAAAAGYTVTALTSTGATYHEIRLGLQADGRLLVGTSSGTSLDASRGFFARYTANGVVENTASGAWSSSRAEDLAIDAAGGIYFPYTYGTGASTTAWVDKYRTAPTPGGTPVTATAAVTVADNDPFAAAADSYTLAQDTTLTVAAPGVLANDTITTPGAPAVVHVTEQGTTYGGPANGALVLNPDGSFTYTPNPGFYGTDYFRYRVVDGAATTAPVLVTLTVTRTNNTAPVAADDAYTILEDRTLTTVLAPEAAAGHALTMVSDNGDYIGQGLTYNFGAAATFSMANPYPSNPTYSNAVSLTVSQGTNQYWSLSFWAPNNARFVAGTTYTNATRFPFNAATVPGLSVSGNGRGSNTLTGFFTVLQAEYTEAGALTRFAATFEQHSEGAVPALRGTVRYNFQPSPLGVLANDTDPENDPRTAALVTGPANGSLTLNPNGTFTYVPAAGWSGVDTFTYTANDFGLASAPATVTINVELVNDRPVAVADSYAMNEDTTLVVGAPGVLGNDADEEGAPLAAQLLTYPASGSLAFSADGSFNYTPGTNFVGTVSFTYRVTDGAVWSDPATVTIAVANVYDPPFATNDLYTVVPGTAFSTTVNNGVLVNDGSPDGRPITAQLVTMPTLGTLTFNTNGTFTYTRAVGASGPDEFTYYAYDGISYSNFLAHVKLNVAAGGVADDYATAEDTPLVVAAPGVLANDPNPDGDPLAAYVWTYPTNGTLSLATDGRFTYTPNANWSGTDRFTYRAWDGVGYGPITAVAVAVTAVNDAPVAQNNSYAAGENVTLTVAAAGVLANDTDIENNPLSAVLVAGPANGTLTLNANGSFAYTPGPNFVGTDTFTYKATDGALDSNVATVTIVVSEGNDIPTAADDAYTVGEDLTLSVGAAGVLGNDSDPDGTPLAAVLVTGPAHGTLTLNPNGSFAYTPATNFNGTDTFTYRATDGVFASAPATVTLTVTPAPDAPTAANDACTLPEDQGISVGAAGVLANDTDPENDPLAAVLVSGPAHGALTLNANGSFTYTPNANYNGADGFTYKATDGGLDSNVATVSLTVTAVNDAPTAGNDSYTTAEDTPLTVAAPGLLGNDADVDNDPLTVTIVATTAHGYLEPNANGGFTYTPHPNWNGTDTFTYRASDGTATSNLATVTIVVTPVNDAPAPQPDFYTTTEDGFIFAATPGVLANDWDPETSPFGLTAELVSGPSHAATFEFNVGGFNGPFYYVPAANWHGTDTFTYRPFDGQLYGAVTTVTITVTPVNDAPVAASSTPGTVTVAEGTAQTFDLSASSDPDGDPLTFTWDFGDGTAPSVGPAVRSYAYADNGTYTVTVTVRDPAGLSAVKTFTATVTNANPGGALTGPTQAVPGLELAFTATATDPGSVDLAANFTYLVTWGDGTTATFTGPASGVTFKKTFTATGTFTPTVRVTDKDGGQATVSAAAVAVTPAAVIGGTLYVGGTTGADTITVTPTGASGTLTVVRNGTTLGTSYAPTADVVVYGLAGGDTIDIKTKKIGGTTYTVARPVYLFGGDGNDALNVAGASAGAVALGGAGADTLTGGSGRDILIGGAGVDTARGGNGEEILIGGIFDYENDLAVLRTVGAEWWRTDSTFAQRVSRLRNGGGLNGAVVLGAATIDDDAATDQLYGENGNDWFLAPAVEIKDFKNGDDRTLL